jgi:hypothetical protein
MSDILNKEQLGFWTDCTLFKVDKTYAWGIVRIFSM